MSNGDKDDETTELRIAAARSRIASTWGNDAATRMTLRLLDAELARIKAPVFRHLGAGQYQIDDRVHDLAAERSKQLVAGASFAWHVIAGFDVPAEMFADGANAYCNGSRNARNAFRRWLERRGHVQLAAEVGRMKIRGDGTVVWDRGGRMAGGSP